MEPDAFTDDPYGYITNQAGHAYLVGAPAVVILATWWGILAPIPIAISYGLIWEIGVQRGRLWKDGFEDTVHVFAGASVMTAALSGDIVSAGIAMAAQGVLLAVGVWRRS